jgi:transposase
MLSKNSCRIELIQRRCPSLSKRGIVNNQHEKEEMMLLTRPNTLSEPQCRELEAFKMHAREAKLYRRAKVILYRNGGYTPDEIEEHTDYSEREQRNWVRRYREEGVEGLYDRPRSGRPRGSASHERGEQPPGENEARQVEQTGRNQSVEEVAYVAPDTTAPKETGHMPLSTWARLTLESMRSYHPKRYLRQRAQMLLLREKGYSADEIASILEVTSGTVRQVWAVYDRHQLGGLYRKPGSGRSSDLSSEQWEQFATWVTAGPKALGYRFVKWTTRSLRKYVFKRFNITFSREWIRQKLHHFVGYSWTRGKKVYAYPANEKRKTDRRAFSRKMLTYLERARKGEIILLFEDESIFTLWGEVGRSWSPQGATQEVPSAGKRGRVVVFGAVDPISGRPHYHLAKTNINKESSLHFLTQLVRYYEKRAPGIPLVIVWDNLYSTSLTAKGL